MESRSDLTMQKIGVGYTRVSTPEQVSNFSLENQREAIERKAKLDGYDLVKIFEELGESAKTTDRTEFKELIKYCMNKENHVNALFVYKIDRLNRNNLDFLILREQLSKHGISIISATEVSGDTPEVHLVQNILGALAEFDNTNKSGRVKDGMLKRFQAGYTTCAAHFGYRKTIIDGKTVEVPDGDKFILLQRMWKKIAYENWNLEQVRKHLNQSGLFPKPFLRQTITKIFTNYFYIGILQSRKYGKAQGKHQPMIDEDVFFKVRAVLTGRNISRVPKNHKMRDELPLRTFLQCYYCKSPVTGAASRARNGSRIFYYNCNSRKHKYYGANAEKVNQEFLNLLKKVRVKEKAMVFFDELMRETYQEEYKDLQTSVSKIKQDVEIVEKTLMNLKKKHLMGLYDDQEFLEMKSELKIELLTKKQLLGEKKVDTLEIENILHWMKYYLTHLDEAWLKASLEGKLAISGSIFPFKLVYMGNAFIEPQLGLAYKLNDIYEAITQHEYPYVADTRTILQEYFKIYNTLNNYVQPQL